MNSMIHRTIRLFICLFFMAMSSCNLNKIEFDEDDSENVQNETVSSAYFDDAGDLSTKSISSADDTNGGKTITVPDTRFTCAVVTIEPDAASTLIHPKGVLTIDFGTGCADGRGNTRSGKVIVTYSGRRFKPGSKVTTSFDNYMINGVQLEGIFSVVNTTASTDENPSFTATVTEGKLTWPDGTAATRSAAIAKHWIRKGTQTDEWNVTGSAIGTNRRSKNYTMEITKELGFQEICQVTHTKLLPSSGTQTLTINNKRILMDFGSGSCDQQVTITINGKSKTIDVTKSN